MSNVQVRNLDNKEYVEMFRDVEIRIPVGGYVEMGRAEAVTFLSQATPMKRDGQGRPLEPKRLEIYQDPEQFAADRDQPYRFQSPDGKDFRTEAGLKEYMAKLEDESRVVTNDEPRRRKKATNA